MKKTAITPTGRVYGSVGRNDGPPGTGAGTERLLRGPARPRWVGVVQAGEQRGYNPASAAVEPRYCSGALVVRLKGFSPWISDLR